MAVIGINYDGTNVNTYESVYLYVSPQLELKFNSGNFVKDWFDAKTHWVQNFEETDPIFSQSSTVDHFFMDGGDSFYDSVYLKVNESGIAYLDYDFRLNGWEFFVPKGVKWTWEELKKHCKEQ